MTNPWQVRQRQVWVNVVWPIHHPPLPQKRGIHPYWLWWTTLREPPQWALPQEILCLTSPMSRFIFSCFSTFFSTSKGKHHQLLIQSHPEPVRDTSHTSGLKFPSPDETIISCLTNKFWDRLPKFTSIYEPWQDDASVYEPKLVSQSSIATHVSFRATAH